MRSDQATFQPISGVPMNWRRMSGFSVWMPTYLIRMRGFDIGGAGKIMGAAFLVGGIVGAVGGPLGVADLVGVIEPFPIELKAPIL